MPVLAMSVLAMSVLATPALALPTLATSVAFGLDFLGCDACAFFSWTCHA